MRDRRLSSPELARTRFATSPLWEAVASLRVLQARDPGLHGPWVTRARAQLRAADMDIGRLLILVPPHGYLADFLTPTPEHRHGDFARELQSLRDTTTAHVQRDLAYLRTTAEQPRKAAIDRALIDLRAYLDAVAGDLHAYWHTTIADDWERLEALAEADIAWRMERMAAGGTHAVFDTLHPRVRMDGVNLVISDYCDDEPAYRDGGIVLVPCAFAWPHLLFLEEPGMASTMSYSPRGVGNLWTSAPRRGPVPLADLLGRTRAAAILLLDLPMTTSQLASHLGISAATANAHLKVLQRARLVDAARRERRVLYSRTPLGWALIRGEDDPTQT